MIASVIVDINHSEVDKVFEYSYDVNDGVLVGSRVLVPFGSKKIEGIVISVSENSLFPIEKVKPIYSVLEDVPALTNETLSLMNYVCEKCFVTKASALRLFLPSEMRKGRVKEKFVTFYQLVEGLDVDQVVPTLKKSAKNQKDALYYLAENGKTESARLCELFGRSSINALVS